jgi:hypothetical protein
MASASADMRALTKTSTKDLSTSGLATAQCWRTGAPRPKLFFTVIVLLL